jgi:chromosome partitioning protein
MRIIAIANQKGGVGKTTTAVNLSACLARANRRTLLVDFDPQSNATIHTTTLNPGSEMKSSYALISEKQPDLSKLIRPISPNWQIIPGHIALAEIDIQIFNIMNREQRLKKALSQVENQFDYGIIDCAPSLSITTVNALCAATHAIIAIQTNWFAYEAIKRLMAIVGDVIDESNPDLVTYALATMHRKNVNIHEEVLTQIRQDFQELMLESVIPYTATLPESSAAKMPICDYADGSKADIAYQSLTKEIIARVETAEEAQVSNIA